VIVSRLLGRIDTMLGSGWKGKAGGIGMILAALAGLLNDVAQGTVTMEKAMAYLAAASAGLGVFGIRSAIK